MPPSSSGSVPPQASQAYSGAWHERCGLRLWAPYASQIGPLCFWLVPIAFPVRGARTLPLPWLCPPSATARPTSPAGPSSVCSGLRSRVVSRPPQSSLHWDQPTPRHRGHLACPTCSCVGRGTLMPSGLASCLPVRFMWSLCGTRKPNPGGLCSCVRRMCTVTRMPGGEPSSVPYL